MTHAPPAPPALPLRARSIHPLVPNVRHVLARSIDPLDPNARSVLARSIHPLGPKNCTGGVTTNPVLTLSASRDIPRTLEAVEGLGGASLAPPKL